MAAVKFTVILNREQREEDKTPRGKILSSHISHLNDLKYYSI